MKQLILPFEQLPTYDARDFIVSSSNEEAYLWLNCWPTWPYPCLALYGESGCGKTHLSSIWQEKSKAHYLRIQDFNTKGLDALFALPPLIILDDAHLVEKEEKLFHFYNHLMSAKGSLLLLSTSAPAHWSTILPDLHSRLSSIPAIKIHGPDEDLLTQVIQKLFSDLQLKVADSVIHFLIKHMERSFQSARMWTSALNTFAITQKRSITIHVVRELLSHPDLVGTHQ